jgi:radical SAM/Cys-rich protein
MDPHTQRKKLQQELTVIPFEENLARHDLFPLKATGVEILQLNITRRCNKQCKHCHVAAGTRETNDMSEKVLRACIDAARTESITTIDITGGCPEMHPALEWVLDELSSLDKRILVRSNLVILTDPRYRHFIDIFARNGVEVVGSLPDYKKSRTDAQRGPGTFDNTVLALQMLNKKGYAMDGSGLTLDLVHNPSGAYLPGNQTALEAEYRATLENKYGIRFNALFCLTNCPAGRYLDYLIRSDNLEDYMSTLSAAYNPKAAGNVMCRSTLSVGPDGRLYDCDFNQMLEIAVNHGAPDHITDFDSSALSSRTICTGNHCYCCTAGAGSSCQGAVDG